MKSLDWQPNFVASCPVKLFEASGGSKTWLPTGNAGEFHMKAFENAVLYFQLRDLLDNQILFEHTMHKPDAFMVAAKRFFVIRLENGSFRGFGFTDDAAAAEMKKKIQEAINPYRIPEPIKASTSELHKTEKETTVVSYESLPKRISKGISQERLSPSSQLEITTFKQRKRSNFRSKWRLVFRGITSLSPLKSLSSVSEFLGLKEHEMEIGYPTDVKHITHIGWDGPSVGRTWVNELKPSPNFSSGPLQEFGQPEGPHWIHDALSAAHWTTPGDKSSSRPPMPPAEFGDSDYQQAEKKNWRLFRSQRKISM